MNFIKTHINEMGYAGMGIFAAVSFAKYLMKVNEIVYDFLIVIAILLFLPFLFKTLWKKKEVKK